MMNNSPNPNANANANAKSSNFQHQLDNGGNLANFLGSMNTNGSASTGTSGVNASVGNMQQGGWLNPNGISNAMAGDLVASTASNRAGVNRLIMNNSSQNGPQSLASPNTSSFLTNRSSYDER
jgi:hypothetical protein